MIIRRKNIKENPATEYTILVAVQPNDVRRALVKFYQKGLEDLPGFENYVYEDKEIEWIICQGTIIHHFTPSIRKKLLKWSIATALAKGYIVEAPESVAKEKYCMKAYTVNSHKLLDTANK